MSPKRDCGSKGVNTINNSFVFLLPTRQPFTIKCQADRCSPTRTSRAPYYSCKWSIKRWSSLFLSQNINPPQPLSSHFNQHLCGALPVEGVSKQNRKAQSKIEFSSISIKRNQGTIVSKQSRHLKIETQAKSNGEHNLLFLYVFPPPSPPPTVIWHISCESFVLRTYSYDMCVTGRYRHHSCTSMEVIAVARSYDTARCETENFA